MQGARSSARPAGTHKSPSTTPRGSGGREAGGGRGRARGRGGRGADDRSGRRHAEEHDSFVQTAGLVESVRAWVEKGRCVARSPAGSTCAVPLSRARMN